MANVYDVIQSIANAQLCDKVVITDDKNAIYELDYIHTDNGFVEFHINTKEG